MLLDVLYGGHRVDDGIMVVWERDVETVVEHEASPRIGQSLLRTGDHVGRDVEPHDLFDGKALQHRFHDPAHPAAELQHGVARFGSGFWEWIEKPIAVATASLQQLV